MQNRMELLHTPPSHSGNVVDDLISHNPEVRKTAAVRYRRWVEKSYQKADVQMYSKISDEINQLITRLSQSSDDYVHLGFLALVNEIVDLSYQEEDRNVRISQYLELLLQDNHSEILIEPLSTVDCILCLNYSLGTWTLASCRQFLFI